ncbi:MAG: ATP-dependent DNA helicase [Candidatus Thorarchaeota archaeon]
MILTTTAQNPMAWFPYQPRPHQERVVHFSEEVFSEGTVGLLSADCGIGKTIATLSGYLSARSIDPTSRLLVLTRTHSQSKVFEEELTLLRVHTQDRLLTATSMVSRKHVCPMKSLMKNLSSLGFMRGCAALVRMGECTRYWNCYKRNEDRRTVPRQTFLENIDKLLNDQVVSRSVAEESGDELGQCPYEVLRWCAKKSKILFGPYDYIFRSRVRMALLTSLGVDLHEIDVLVDEAHNLSSHVLEAEAAELRGSDMIWLRDHKRDIVKETGVQWLEETVDFLWETTMVNLDTLRGERRLDKWDAYPRFAAHGDLDRLIDYSTPIEGVDDSVPMDTPVDRLVSFLYAGKRATESDDWLVTIELSPGWEEHLGKDLSRVILKIRPLNAAGLVAQVLRASRSALLMSGTLRPLSHYKCILGLGSAKGEELSSPYPRGTRLILVDKEVSTSYRIRNPDLWREIGARIEIVLNAVPANKSAMIAFPSYAIMQDVLSFGINSGFREPLVEDRTIRIDDVKTALATKPHAIFCVYGGKVSEGVDLVDAGSSMVDIIIGVGLPFSPPTSHQKALQDFYDRRYGSGSGYYYAAVVPSIRKVAQMAGRLRRSPDDRGIIVLLDKRFLKHIDVFGEDTAADLWPYRSVGELKEAIEMFVKGGVTNEELP